MGRAMTIHTEPMTVNVGPQHPSTHGVFRLRVTFDGEEIMEVEPVFGYLHRGTEKLAEERNYVQIVTLTDRLDYVSSMINNQAYCLAVEKLLGVEPPPRAKYLRTLVAELQRVASHLMGIGFFVQDLGALGTPLMYCFRTREKILDLFEMLCGARITVSYMRPGGVFADAPKDFWPALNTFLEEFPSEFGEIEQLLLENEIVMVRTRGVSTLPLDLLRLTRRSAVQSCGLPAWPGTGERWSHTTPTTRWSLTFRWPRTATTTTDFGCACKRYTRASESSANASSKSSPVRPGWSCPWY